MYPGIRSHPARNEFTPSWLSVRASARRMSSLVCRFSQPPQSVITVSRRGIGVPAQGSASRRRARASAYSWIPIVDSAQTGVAASAVPTTIVTRLPASALSSNVFTTFPSTLNSNASLSFVTGLLMPSA